MANRGSVAQGASEPAALGGTRGNAFIRCLKSAILFEASVLLESMKQDDEILRPLKQHAVAGLPEPNSKLPELTLDLRRNRMLRRRRGGVLTVQVLFDEVVDLRCRLRIEIVDEFVDGLPTTPITKVDCLSPGHH